MKVIVLAATGPHFSSGHDLRENKNPQQMEQFKTFKTVGTWCGFGNALAPKHRCRAKRRCILVLRAWRNIPKPTIAKVQGK